jgi:hypothetical protein
MRARSNVTLLAAMILVSLVVAAPAWAQEEQQQQDPEVFVDDIHVPSSPGKLVEPGIRVSAGCYANCLLLVEVKLPRSVADKLGLRKTQIAQAVGDVQAGQATTLFAHVKRGVAERLRAYTGNKRLRIEIKAFP